MEYLKNYDKQFRHLASLPFIYMVIFPIVILDVILEVYHHVCFSLWGIPLIDRNKYIAIDRHKLEYLDVIQKFNCAYCGYANGFLAYALAITARTEKYWCGIKHKEREGFEVPEYQQEFADYDDAEAFEAKYRK